MPSSCSTSSDVDGPVRVDEEVAKRAELAPRAHDGAAEERSAKIASDRGRSPRPRAAGGPTARRSRPRAGLRRRRRGTAGSRRRRARRSRARATPGRRAAGRPGRPRRISWSCTGSCSSSVADLDPIDVMVPHRSAAVETPATSGTNRQGTLRRTAGPSGVRTTTSSHCPPEPPTGTTRRPRGSSWS